MHARCIPDLGPVLSAHSFFPRLQVHVSGAGLTNEQAAIGAQQKGSFSAASHFPPTLPCSVLRGVWLWTLAMIL